MRYSKRDFREHLEREHKINPLSVYLKEIVYGGNDGIVTTFAVVAGFTGASAGDSIPTFSAVAVLLFGLANLFADGTSMGLGNFLSVRSEQDIYRSHKHRELSEIRENPEMERAETVHILRTKGFSRKDAETIATIYSKNEQSWLDFMMNHELEMPNPEHDNPLLTGTVTFFSFVFFGLIPIVPYIFMESLENIFSVSVSFAFLALVLLGMLRWRVTKQTLWRSVGEVVLVGGTSAVIAFIVGTFFRA